MALSINSRKLCFIRVTYHRARCRMVCSDTTTTTDDRFTSFRQKCMAFFRTSPDYEGISIPARDDSPSKNLSACGSGCISVADLVSKTRHMKPCQKDSILAPTLSSCSSSQALQLATARLQASHEDIQQSVFYKLLMVQAHRWVTESRDHRELVAWAFWCSLAKRPHQAAAVRHLGLVYQRFKTQLPLFQNLSLFEMSIVCNALFTGGVVISSMPLLRHIDSMLASELDNHVGLMRDVSIPLLKVLRKAGFATDNALDALARSLSSPSCRNVSVGSLAHGMALLADHRCVVNEELLSNIRHIVRANQEEDWRPMASSVYVHPLHGVRIKDLVRLTWALSCTVPQPRLEAECSVLVDTLICQVARCWERGHFGGDNVHLMSDFLLALACWNVYPGQLIEKVVRQPLIDAISAQSHQNIRLSRLALFLVAAGIEAPHLQIPASYLAQVASRLPSCSSVEKQLQKRPRLARLAASISRQSKALGWEATQCHAMIPHLQIVGFTFQFNGSSVAVELLEPSVCMRHSKQPDRLLSLKIRLAKQLGYKVIELRCQDPGISGSRMHEGNESQKWEEVQVMTIKSRLEFS